MSTIALCVICKNERNNLPRLLDSVHGCFDEIHITDTGSTDGTIEWLTEQQEQGKLHLHHFKWIDDFAAARNYSFSHATTDYIMWMDCDDALSDAGNFVSWKQTLLNTANYWFATYHYGLDKDKSPICSFMRERVFLRQADYRWRYFIHEGVTPASTKVTTKVAYVTSWTVLHLRSEEDIKVDRNRNLSIFEKHIGELDARMTYYYGKELFEAQKPLEAYSKLMEAAKKPELEIHDRILSLQYACMSAMLLNQYEEAILLAYKGLMLSPHRAEFYVIIGDSYLKLNQYDNAIPSFVAATRCINSAPNNAVFQAPIFTQSAAHDHYPRNQLARLYFHRGDIANSKKWLQEAIDIGPNAETGMLMAEVMKLNQVMQITEKPVVDEYVVTCPQAAMYQWDELIAKERGIGGSETAVVRMARLLHEKSGKTVRIFQDRPQRLEVDGVIYDTHVAAREYFTKQQPKAHIAWRHCVPLTKAPTFLWCHDLSVQGIERQVGFDKVLALSDFHSNYLQHIFRIPKEKIILTRNGIDLDRFSGLKMDAKDPNAIVFSSSPDRGLDRAIYVVSRARQISGKPLTLHCFYGFDNMLKLNLNKEVQRLQDLVDAHPWVKFHGNVQQNTLASWLSGMKAWIYPTDFLETFCITALEMLACRVTPVVRRHGALPYTLKDMPGFVVDHDCVSEADIHNWAEYLLMGLEIPMPPIDMERFTWNNVVDEWLKFLPQ